MFYSIAEFSILRRKHNFTMKKCSKRIYWIDGLRGFACLMIFIHHFSLGFFPASYYGGKVVSHINNGIDISLSQYPLSVIYNGDFWVCIFCLLSGLVQSYKIFCTDGLGKVPEDMLKRYLRLSLPVFAVSFFVYLMMHLNLFYNLKINDVVESPWLGAFYLDKASFKDVFISSFITDWVTKNPMFSNAFWMLEYILIGSYITYILAIIVKDKKPRVLIVLFFTGLLFYNRQDYYLLFVIGVFIAYIMTYFDKQYKGQIVLGAIFIFIGLFFGGYPSGVTPDNIYHYFNSIGYVKCHILGAALFVFGIYNCRFLINILESKVLLWFGKESFAIYLIHIPMIFSVTSYIFMKAYSVSGRYQMSAGVSFLISLVLIILLAWLFNKYVEKACGKITGIVVKWIYETEKK